MAAWPLRFGSIPSLKYHSPSAAGGFLGSYVGFQSEGLTSRRRSAVPIDRRQKKVTQNIVEGISI